MLAGLRPQQLAQLFLPLGERTKEQTRALAQEFGLDVASKPDSMDLCFVDGDYRAFVHARHPEARRRGPILTVAGELVGEHDGVLEYTVGQRKGLPTTLHDGPWYVVRTDSAANAVIIGRRQDLERDSARCSAVNVVRPERFDASGSVAGLAVCRYRSKPVPAVATLERDGSMSVRFKETVALLSPGQLLVMYDASGEEVVVSGIIEQ